MNKYRTRVDIHTLTRIEKEAFIQRVTVEFFTNYSCRFVVNPEYINYVMHKWNKRRFDRMSRDIEITNTTTRKRVKI